MSVSMDMENLVKIHQFIIVILSANVILTSFKGNKSFYKLVKIDVKQSQPRSYQSIITKFAQNPSILCEDIEWKQNFDINQGS